jgi:DNA-binding beta-propeller fold protein YncE
MFGASYGHVNIFVRARNRGTFGMRSAAYVHSRKLHRFIWKVKSWTGFVDVDISKPTDVAISKNGDILVTDGYGSSRVVKFDRNGNFIKNWGTYGSGTSEFMLAHFVVIDRNDRVYVGDRENARIQIFNTDGRFLAQWTGIGYPYGLCITPNQHVWMVDGGFDRIIELDQTGKILDSIGSPGHQRGQLAVRGGLGSLRG